MSDPVCPLKLAFYGLPDSGGHWQARCARHLRIVGFTEVDPWRSCFWHEELKSLLVVYIDYFKLAEPEAACIVMAVETPDVSRPPPLFRSPDSE